MFNITMCIKTISKQEQGINVIKNLETLVVGVGGNNMKIQILYKFEDQLDM
jgi:hypothetical protein